MQCSLCFIFPLYGSAFWKSLSFCLRRSSMFDLNRIVLLKGFEWQPPNQTIQVDRSSNNSAWLAHIPAVVWPAPAHFHVYAQMRRISGYQYREWFEVTIVGWRIYFSCADGNVRCRCRIENCWSGRWRVFCYVFVSQIYLLRMDEKDERGESWCILLCLAVWR